MYGQRGKVRNSDTWRQKRHGTPRFTTTAAERIAAWEKKQAEAKVKAGQQ